MEIGTMLCAYHGKLYKVGEFHPGVKDVEKTRHDRIYTIAYQELQHNTGECHTAYYIGVPDFDFLEEDFNCEDCQNGGSDDEEIKDNCFCVDWSDESPINLRWDDPKILGWFELEEV